MFNLDTGSAKILANNSFCQSFSTNKEDSESRRVRNTYRGFEIRTCLCWWDNGSGSKVNDRQGSANQRSELLAKLFKARFRYSLLFSTGHRGQGSKFWFDSNSLLAQDRLDLTDHASGIYKRKGMGFRKIHSQRSGSITNFRCESAAANAWDVSVSKSFSFCRQPTSGVQRREHKGPTSPSKRTQM